MPAKLHGINPYSSTGRQGQPPSIRVAYIQNLANLLHFALLDDDMDTAYRAWSILIRCPEVDWEARWYWGLDILESTIDEPPQSYSFPSLSGSQMATGREQERYLKMLRVNAKERDKPTLLHALVLHLINHQRYHAALEELETYLSSYPYLTSPTLHTYAGLLSFYLAQPPGRQRPSVHERERTFTPVREGSVDTVLSQSSSAIFGPRPKQTPDRSLLRDARGWFSKALELDPSDQVAAEFLRLIDEPVASDQDDSDDEKWDEKENSIISDDDSLPEKETIRSLSNDSE